jgi:predicted DNA binding CopG/RHH family protein
MKKREKFENAPKGKVTIIEDFLPTPAQLVKKEEMTKVTCEFTKTSIDYLKEEAKKMNVPYQQILREVVNYYVSRQL